MQLREALTAGAAAAAAGMEMNDFLALDPHTREFLRKTLNEDAKSLMAELGNDSKAKGQPRTLLSSAGDELEDEEEESVSNVGTVF